MICPSVNVVSVKQCGYIGSWVCRCLVTWFCHQPMTLQWHQNGRNGVSNHQPHDCLLNHLFRHRIKKSSKIRVTGLCERNSPVNVEFSAQRASNEENVSIWWRHDDPTRIDSTITTTEHNKTCMCFLGFTYHNERVRDTFVWALSDNSYICISHDMFDWYDC